MARHLVDVHVGERLKHFRQVAGVSQKQLAARLGVVYQQIQKYESGTNRLGPHALFESASLLGCSVADFFAGLDGAGEHESVSSDVRRLAHDLDAIEDPALLDAFYFLVRRYNAS